MSAIDLAQDAAAMRRIFMRLGLAQAGEEVKAVALTGGVSSGIYRVDLGSGSYCVKQALPQLKVAKEWKVPVERVFSEIAYLRTVAEIAPGHVPRVIGQDDETKSFVMEFLGPQFRNWKADMLAGRVDIPVAQQAGDMLGRIHAATADNADIARQFATDENFYAIRLEPYLVEAARVHPPLAPVLHGLVERTAGTRRVLVHGDVSPKNILVGPEYCHPGLDPGSLAVDQARSFNRQRPRFKSGVASSPVLLDAECAWFGDPAFDLAFCLNHFLLKTAHMPQHANELMASFVTMKDAYFAHVAWEPQDELEARVATLLPGLTLARVDGKSPVEYLGEPQRVTVRRLATKLLQQAPVSLDLVAGSWAWECMQ